MREPSRFDDFSRGVASTMPRRRVLKLGALLLAGSLTSFVPRSARGANIRCLNDGDCDEGHICCMHPHSQHRNVCYDPGDTVDGCCEAEGCAGNQGSVKTCEFCIGGEFLPGLVCSGDTCIEDCVAHGHGPLHDRATADDEESAREALKRQLATACTNFCSDFICTEGTCSSKASISDDEITCHETAIGDTRCTGTIACRCGC